MTYGPPILIADTNPTNKNPKRRRAFRFNQCAQTAVGVHVEKADPGVKGLLEKIEKNGSSRQCHNEGDNPGEIQVRWATVIYGLFWYRWHEEVWLAEAPECNEWSETNQPVPHRKHCIVHGGQWKAYWPHKVDVLGQWRFDTGAFYSPEWAGGQEACFEIDGVLPSVPQAGSENGESIYHENFHFFYEPIGYSGNTPCPWGSLAFQGQ